MALLPFLNRNSNNLGGIRPEARRWSLIAATALAALVFSTGAVFGVRWIYHQATKPSNKTTTKAPQSDRTTTPHAPPVANPPAGAPTPPSALPDNGPGDVIALFITTTLVASALHLAIMRRRQKVLRS